MKREDIIEMAMEAGAISYSPPPMRAVAGVSFTYAQLQRFADIVAEGAAFAEREACAKLADEYIEGCEGTNFGVGKVIRARGNT
jgi:hypothetical protein